MAARLLRCINTVQRTGQPLVINEHTYNRGKYSYILLWLLIGTMISSMTLLVHDTRNSVLAGWKTLWGNSGKLMISILSL